MRVFLGTDHAGLELKAHLMTVLADEGFEPVDCGAFDYDPQDDYPPFCFEVGERTVAEPGSLGAREYDVPTAAGFVDTFLATPFSHDPRHQRRIDLVAAYEADPVPQDLPAT